MIIGSLLPEKIEARRYDEESFIIHTGKGGEMTNIIGRKQEYRERHPGPGLGLFTRQTGGRRIKRALPRAPAPESGCQQDVCHTGF